MWDTAIAVRALAASGVRPENPAMREAIEWLLSQQIKRRGDWAETVDAEPGGWCFEYANDFYPDSDDTAMVLMALETQFTGSAGGRRVCRPTYGSAMLPARTGPSPEDDNRRVAEMDNTLAAIDRGLRWMLAMQNRDGGWGAFDRNNTAVSLPCPVCRSQRHDRPQHSRLGRPRVGGPGTIGTPPGR